MGKAICRKWGWGFGRAHKSSGSVLDIDFEKVGPDMLVHTFDPSKISETRQAWSIE